MEDPAEDVFVTLVSTSRGNFRIFEGIRESTGFYLQRVLNIAEDMPSGAPFDDMREVVHCLLRISDAVAERVGVREYTLGQELPLKTLPPDLADTLDATREFVRFSECELQNLNFTPTVREEFGFDFNNRNRLPEQVPGHTDLERRPIAFHGDFAYLLLPTAVGTAITRYIADSVASLGLIGRSKEPSYANLLIFSIRLGFLGARSEQKYRSRKSKAGGWAQSERRSTVAATYISSSLLVE